MQIVIAGASGFLGTHLTDALRERGHEVTRLVRRTASAPDESSWDPYAGEVDQQVVAGADVVVNLAGAPLFGNPHTQRYARAQRDSRVVTTRVLADAIASAGGRPAFLAGNGTSWYGDHGPQVLTEASDSRGHALLTEVAREWQSATGPAAEAGSRVCLLRTAPVMDRRAGALQVLAPLFRFGLGARLGSGEQHMPMISLRDWVAAVVHLAEHPDAHGPFNLCCARTPTNAEFTRALARAVHRPAVPFLPAPLLRVGAGRMSAELLGSINVRPAALLERGLELRDPDVESVVATGLS